MTESASPTDRLYFADPYLATFDARVTARRETGGRPEVALDRSAFYPEGGGQPPDYGRLNDAAVVDVQADDAGTVWHTLDRALSSDAVRGEIDWARRFDHMQQHHGQHLLSAAFEQLYQLRTVSFHLGAEAATIDVSGGQLSEDQAIAAEALTNRIIWEDHPVNARFVSPEELVRIPLRKAPVVQGAIRVVSVADFDHSACGGTHPRATGGVGILHLRRWERRGNDVRVEFQCGGRVLRDTRWKNGVMTRLSNQLTVGADELEASIGRLRDAEDQARKRLETVGEQLADYEARDLLSAAPPTGKPPVVSQAFSDRKMDDVKTLARAIAARGGIALLGLRGDKVQLVFARGANVTLDCGALLKTTVTKLGGRGGGQPAMAQGGLPNGELLDQALADAAAAARG